MIGDMWRILGALLDSRADVVIRLGGKNTSPMQLIERLTASSVLSHRKVKLRDFEVSEIRRRQTDAFRPGSKGCIREVDCHYRIA
jgi:hypothetical protein